MEVFAVSIFTTSEFGGNPAAVCLLGEKERNVKRAAVAVELGRTTAFLKPTSQKDEDGSWAVEWWTGNGTELPLCGHASIAAAHVLFHHKEVKSSALSFETKAGVVLNFRRLADGRVAMDLPLAPLENISPKQEKVAAAMEKAAAGGLSVAKRLYSFSGGFKNLILVLGKEVSAAQLAAHVPDAKAVLAADPKGQLLRVVTLTVAGDGGSGAVFCPVLGYDEDPVTGSAHSPLANYWAKELGKDHLQAQQSSKRSGDLELDVRREAASLTIAGAAKTFLTGTLKL